MNVLGTTSIGTFSPTNALAVVSSAVRIPPANSNGETSPSSLSTEDFLLVAFGFGFVVLRSVFLDGIASPVSLAL